MTTVLNTRSLTVKIADICVCRNLNLDINPGDRWGILGVNGVGKTTLLHTLAGLHRPDTGNINYGEHSLEELSLRQRARYRSILFQDNSDPFPSTVLENVLIGRHPHIDYWQWESQRDIEIARDNIYRMELQNREQQMVNTLSGGERQRVAIATLLSQQARLLLLDEPTSHLDLKRQMKIMKILSQSIDHEKSASVMILHDLNIASRFCNRILMLFGKGEFNQGSCSEMLTDQHLNRLYDYPIRRVNHEGRAMFIPG